MSSDINVQPYSLGYDVTKIRITRVDVQLFSGAKIEVALFVGDQVVRGVQLDMPTEDYDQWLDDDEYLVSWVLTKLGMTPVPNPTGPTGPVDGPTGPVEVPVDGPTGP